jgi:UDP-N-acetylmuramoylalanine--D-glutamate ligase
MPELLAAKIGLELGLHRQETFLRSDFIVVSPGVPGDLAQLVAARQHKVRILPEVEAASWFLKGRLVGITGSNGKTTTTTLLGRMLQASGFNTFVGGNIGVPLISAVDQTAPDSISVAELSSFQLEAVRDFRVNVAVLLNISPNHLDRHPSFDAYVTAKAGIFRNQTADDWAVLNADDATVMSFSPALSSRKVLFSLHQDLPDGVLVSDGQVLYRVNNLERVLMDVDDVKLRGAFNLENVLAATAAACALGADFDVLPRVVRDFRGVEHRLEYVRQIRGVDFYNDSKATSVDATLKALSAFEHGVHLILGGKDKGAPYAPLRPLLERRARKVLLIGAAADRIAKELEGAADLVRASDLETAVREAFRAAVPGDTVLLAPACASFDQFQDFEHRGRVFKEVAEHLAAEEETFIRNSKLETGTSKLEIRKSRIETGNLAPQEPVEPVRSSEQAHEALSTRRPKIETGGSKLEVGNWKLETGNWKLETEISDDSADTSVDSRISSFESQQPPISSGQSAMPPAPRVLSRPELLFVYEVAAEELAPMEGEPSAAVGGPQGAVYEEFELVRPLPARETGDELFPYEVPVADAGRRGEDARPAPTEGERPAPRPTDSDVHSGRGSSSREGGSGQGTLFEDNKTSG